MKLDPSPRFLVIDPHSPVMDNIVRELLLRGYRVEALAILPSTLAWDEVPRRTLQDEGESDVLVFDLPRFDEALLVDDTSRRAEWTDAVAEESNRFLETVQALLKRQVFLGGGSLWTLEMDDFFEYYFPLPISPMASQFRISCFRSLCKEFARFNLQFNNLVFQPSLESVAPEQYKAQREHLKVFSLKYKLPTMAANAKALCDQLAQVSPLVNGSVVQLGVSPNGSNY